MNRFPTLTPLIVAVSLVIANSALAQPPVMEVSPTFININILGDTSFPIGTWGVVSVRSFGNIPFKVVAEPSFGGEPNFNFLIVSPSSGTSPATFGYSLNPNVVPYMAPGPHEMALSLKYVDQPAFNPGPAVRVRLFLQVQRPVITAVVDSASSQPSIAPGQLVTIYGSHLSTPPQTAQVSGDGFYPTTLGYTSVTFNGIPAPILYVSNNQINCVVPFGIVGQNSVEVVLSREQPGLYDTKLTVPAKDTSPGIFTVDQSGKGQAAVLNVDSLNSNLTTSNSSNNPAASGSYITFFASGAGLWDTPNFKGTLFDGSIPLIYMVPKAAVTLTIGGQPAKIAYLGAAIGRIGSLQVNAIVPEGIDSGAQPIVLKIGDNDNAAQQATIFIK